MPSLILLLSSLAMASTGPIFAGAAPSGCKPAYYPSTPKTCPPVTGDISIKNFRYYPENADWDTKRCLLYASALPNATLMIYNPYTTEQTVIEFPGISHNSTWNTLGIDYHAATDSLYIGAGSGKAWTSAGKDVPPSPNVLIKFDPESRKTEWVADLDPFVARVNAATGFKTGGFQDQAEDAEGNSYVAGAFGDIIAKIDGKAGSVKPFYVTPKERMNATSFGMLGLVTVGEGKKLVVADNNFKRYVTFDLTEDEAEPVEVKLSKVPANEPPLWCDGLYGPPKYSDKVLLCSNNFYQGMDAGAIVAYGSHDNWETAEQLGVILNNDFSGTSNSTPVATVQMGDSIYILEEYFFDDPAKPFDYAERSTFPMIDITSKVEELVKGFM